MNKFANINSGTLGPASRPSRAEAEQAVSTLIRWAGDDPNREGLSETPARVARAYEQWFAGYGEEPEEFLRRTFKEVAGYDEMVLLRDIRFVSRYAKRLQIQERITAEIANTLERVLQPQGVAVVIEGTHGCMTSRGVSQREATMVTSRMLGAFRDQTETRQEFLSAIDLMRSGKLSA